MVAFSPSKRSRFFGSSRAVLAERTATASVRVFFPVSAARMDASSACGPRHLSRAADTIPFLRIMQD